MDITISVTVSNDLKSTAVERCKELLVHGLVADNEFVMSAVIMKPYRIGVSELHDSGTGYTPDESTRQER
jgi:hypothetical protein